MGQPAKERILIVEDHPATRKLIANILKDYELFQAEDGQEALYILEREQDISLILLDILMPKLNGYEVCKKVKKDSRTKQIPIIFLTMLDSEGDEKKGFELGVNDYVTKPVNAVKLLTRVKNQLELKRKKDLLKKKNIALQKALDHIKTLHGVLPICSFCKNIRNDSDEWETIEDYIKKRSKAIFSHSVCPSCMKKHYPDLS